MRGLAAIILCLAILLAGVISADDTYIPIVIGGGGEAGPTDPEPEPEPTATPEPENFISHAGTFPSNLPSGGHAQLTMGGYGRLVDLTYPFGAESHTLLFDIPDSAELVDFSAANLNCQERGDNGLSCRPALQELDGYLWFVSVTVFLHDGCDFDISAEKHFSAWSERSPQQSTVTSDLVWFRCGGGS